MGAFDTSGATALTVEELRKLVVTGSGKEPVEEKLQECGVDPEEVTASVLISVRNGKVEGSRWMVTGSLGMVTVLTAKLGGERGKTMELDLGDLTAFTFPGEENPKFGVNRSSWIAAIDIASKLTTKEGTITDKKEMEKDQLVKNGGFSVRLLVLPTKMGQAMVWLVAAPGEPGYIEQEAVKRGYNAYSANIPTLGVQLISKHAGTEARARMSPKEEEMGLKKRWGMYPLILVGYTGVETSGNIFNSQKLDELDFPPSRTIWREFSQTLRMVEGHCNKKTPSVEKFWAEVDPEAWPKETVWQVKEGMKFPVGKTLKGLTGRTGAPTGKPVRVTGLKYSRRGGFSGKCLGPGLQPQLAAALVEAANFSLASSTWRAYASVWKQINRISVETGITFRLPMTVQMVQGLVGALIRKNLKASTILSYLSSVKKSHEVKGLDASALSDKMVLAAIKGTKNKEGMEPGKRVVMTLEDLATARLNLRKMKMPSKQKKACWTAMVFLFMGSMRPSEILTPDKKKYDPLKTMLNSDLKVVKVQTGEEMVTTLQLKLKCPKTSRTLPTQVVELPEVGGWLCPVRALREWQGTMKGKRTGGTPLFSHEDGTLLTITDLNEVLSKILPDKEPPLNSRGFRPALPTILARQGASEELLKSLGRWTSRTYLHYVREGRTGDWRGLLMKLRSLKI